MLWFDINPKLAGQNKIYRAYIKTKNQTVLLDPTNDVRLHSLLRNAHIIRSLAVYQVYVHQSVSVSSCLLCLRQSLDLLYFRSCRKLANTGLLLMLVIIVKKWFNYLLCKYEWESFHLNAQQSKINFLLFKFTLVYLWA